MKKKPATPIPGTQRPCFSNGQTMEEYCRERGIPYRDTTKEHIGETALYFFSPTPADESPETEDVDGLEPVDTTDRPE